MGLFEDLQKLTESNKNSEKIMNSNDLHTQTEMENALKEYYQSTKSIENITNTMMVSMLKNNSVDKIINQIIHSNPNAIDLKALENHYYHEALNEIEDKLGIDPLNKHLSVDDKEVSKKLIDEFASKHPEINCQSIVENHKNETFKNNINYFVKSDYNVSYPIIEEFIQEEDEKLIEDQLSQELNNPEKPMITSYYKEEEINKIKNEFDDVLDDESFINNLDYINKNILIKQDPESLNTYGLISEKMGANGALWNHFEGIEFMQENDYFKDSLKFEGKKVIPSSEANYQDKSKLIQEYNKLDYQLSDETKKLLKQALHKLVNMKDLDGNPIFEPNKKDEESFKIYAFKNIPNALLKSEELINKWNDSKTTPEEKENLRKDINKTVQFHKDSIQDYQELMNIMSQLGDGLNFPANISVSRNANMPEFIVKDYANVSKVNGLWQMLPLIHDSGLSIDEFVDNPKLGMEKFNENFSNFKPYQDYAKEHGDLDFIEMMDPQNKSPEAVNFKNAALNSVNTMRKTNLFSSIEKNPDMAKNNKMKNALQINYIFNNNLTQYGKLKNFYGSTKEDKTKTIKNILVNMDDNKNMISLSNSLGITVDPVSGQKMEKFNYDAYLENVDTKKLTEKLTQTKEQLESGKYKHTGDLVKNSIKSISRDLLQTKDLINTNEFESILNLSEKSIDDYMQLKAGTNSIKNYANELITKNKGKLNNDNIKESIYAVKAVQNHYDSRSKFGKIFNPFAWNEKININNMKSTLTKSGIDSQKLKDVLENKQSVSDFVKEYKHEDLILNQSINKEKVTGLKEKIDGIDNDSRKVDRTSLKNKTVENVNEKTY